MARSRIRKNGFCLKNRLKDSCCSLGSFPKEQDCSSQDEETLGNSLKVAKLKSVTAGATQSKMLARHLSSYGDGTVILHMWLTLVALLQSWSDTWQGSHAGAHPATPILSNV
eukprot:3153150-Amphidinium_carterae.1